MGLMYRIALEDYRGMLFKFESPQSCPVLDEKCTHSARYDLSTGWGSKAIAALCACTTSPCPTYGPETLVNQVIELVEEQLNLV